MKYAVFTAIPFVGHYNPLIAMASELQRRGWRVAIAAVSELRQHVSREAPHLRFIDLGSLGVFDERIKQIARDASADPNFYRGAARFLPMFDFIWPLMFDGLVASIRQERPDLLVVDIFTWSGFDAAEVTGVPVVVNNPSLLTGVPLEIMPPAPEIPLFISTRSVHSVGRVRKALYPVMRRVAIGLARLVVGRQMNRLRRSRGLPPSRLIAAMREMPILVNGAFGVDYPQPLPPNVEMVGPMLTGPVAPLPADLEAWVREGPPVVYVNLGTVVSASPGLLARILGGLDAPGSRALWVLKPAQAALLPQPLPAWLRVVDWLPSPRALLAHPNVHAFVSHCGINSAYESVAAGTPIVGIPFFADQRDMAVRLADAGVGVWLNKSTFTAADLRAAVTRVLGEPRFRAPMASLQDALTRAGGVPRAVDVIARAATRPLSKSA